jgi:hypothetical protein
VARITAAIAFTLLAAPAYAQQAVPSDNDLRSAYCMAVLKLEIPWFQDISAKVDAEPPTPVSAEAQQKNPALKQAVAESERAQAKARTLMHDKLVKLHGAQDRIVAYLLPRVSSLEPAAMLMAMQRGDADWQQFLAQSKTSHIDDELGSRIRTCSEPTWLPL